MRHVLFFNSNDELIIARGLPSLTLKYFSIYICVQLTAANYVVFFVLARKRQVNVLVSKTVLKMFDTFYGTLLCMLMCISFKSA